MKKYMGYFSVFLAVLLAGCSGVNENLEVRKIEPPKLDAAYLGKKILCHRPMRHGSPSMNVIEQDGKVIANNYGHGGSGWTLGPGSASYVNGLLEESAGKKLTKHSKITIVGAGAIGLFTALDLVQRGYKHITIVAEKFDDLTSHNAGGLLAPVSMDNDPEMQKVINKIGIDAYKFYEKIAKGHDAIFKEGAVIVPTYFRTRDESGLEPYVGVVMKPAKDVLLDFGTGTQQRMVSYDDGIFFDTSLLMTSLTKFLTGKVKFKQQKINSFSEIKSHFIINCSGLGAKHLSGDNKMVPVQGHLIMLKDQKPANLQHMILVYFGEAKTKEGFKAKRSFYMFPKRLPNTGLNDVGVIGGTFIEGADADHPNTEEFDIMIQGAKDFYGIS